MLFVARRLVGHARFVVIRRVVVYVWSNGGARHGAGYGGGEVRAAGGPEHRVWGPGGIFGVAERQKSRVELRAIELWRDETWWTVSQGGGDDGVEWFVPARIFCSLDA